MQGNCGFLERNEIYLNDMTCQSKFTQMSLLELQFIEDKGIQKFNFKRKNDYDLPVC